MFDRGWTDGLPVVAAHRGAGAAHARGHDPGARRGRRRRPARPGGVHGREGRDQRGDGGCKPEYLPVVLAAVEAACTDAFNIHGVLATTMPVGPVIIVNGPIRRAIGMNSGGNVLGQGNRANATIGRALQLVIRNVGGGRPGEVDRATLGNPGKLTFCFAEDEEGSPWEPLSVERGFAPTASDGHAVRRARARAASSISSSRDPEIAGPHARSVPAHRRTIRSCRSASTRCSSSARSTPGCSARRGGRGEAARRAPRAAAAVRRRSSCGARAAWPKGSPSS